MNNVYVLESPLAQEFSGSPTFTYSKNNRFSALGILFATGGDDPTKTHGMGFRGDIIYAFLPTM